MKKQFLASTALVAAGVLAAAPQASAQTVKLGVHGYMEQIVGVVFDREDAEASAAAANSATAVDQQTESEVHFRGSGKLDNGIQIVADVQMEVAGSPGNIIDEQYLIARGSFGQVILGSEDNAGHLMTIGYQGSWPTGVGQSLTFDRTDWISVARSGIPAGARFDGTLNDVRLRSLDNDSSKISYFTPRFSGFQVGVSYIPTFSQQTSTSADLPVKKASTTGGTSGYHEGWAFGANWNGKFDQIGIGVAFGYLTAQSDGTNQTETAATYADADDMKAYAAGLRIDFGGFRIAAGVKVNDDVYSGVSAGTATTRSLSGTIYDIGARYTMGANQFSVGWSHGEMDAEIGNGDEEEDGLMISYARNLGPGVKYTANLMYADFQNDVAPGCTTSCSNSGWAATTSLRLSF